MPASLVLREPLVRVLPRTATLFAALGLPVNLVGLAFQDVSSSLGEDAGRPVLVVEGRITNTSAVRTATRPLELEIEGEDGSVLYTWSARSQVAALEPGAAAPFRARLASPPPAGRRVLVRFGSDKARREVALR